MDTLESYLSNDLPLDQRDIKDIEALLASVIQGYVNIYKDDSAWPYEIKASEAHKSANLSQGTTAMILGALLRFGDYFKSEPQKGSEINIVDGKELAHISKKNVFPIPKDSIHPELKTKIQAASNVLLEALKMNGSTDRPLSEGTQNTVNKNEEPTRSTSTEITNQHTEILEKTIVKSKTFGKNDVFSLAWLAEICNADWNDIHNGRIKEEWQKIGQEIAEVCDTKIRISQYFLYPAKLFDPGESVGTPLKHAFPALRAVQAIRRIKGQDHGALPTAYKYFEQSLHEQLSFSSIPDSRFDPAELMFCLEGMLLCQKNTVDRTLFDRVIEVLTKAQHESAYWRPVKPYLASAQGSVIFPVSVEIANSLLRACAIFDENQMHDTYGSKCIGLLRRYWQWLRVRAVRFKKTLEGSNKVTEFVGWHSEHVNEPTVIHLWETSQVIEFLLSYRNALHSHIARTTLIRSRIKYTPIEKPEDWNTLQETYEPVLGLGDGLKIYKKIKDYFILPHKNKKNENYSMLLYGPPGTGKTTIAESIAKALERRLIIVTVSDFLAEGGAQVEARAKNIFEVLMAQPSSVILFDEIDHFLLDRDSDRYIKQDTVFQFMTPGMLTKLNDLRRSKGSIFIVATNYEDRIDAAIKRTGRIDYKFLVMPPDMARRRSMLEKLLREKWGSIVPTPITENNLTDFAKAAVFLGYKDIEAILNSINIKPNDDVNAYVHELTQQLIYRARTTSLGAYRSRFFVGNGSEDIPKDIKETPIDEFLGLVALLAETNNTPSDEEKRILSKVGHIIKGEGPLDANCIIKHASYLEENMANEVVKLLAPPVPS